MERTDKKREDILRIAQYKVDLKHRIDLFNRAQPKKPDEKLEDEIKKLEAVCSHSPPKVQ